MTELLFAIRDIKSQKFSQCSIAPNAQVYERDIKTSIANNPNSMLARNAEDFEIWCMGSYDYESGLINQELQNVKCPYFILSAAALIEPKVKE